jgi:ATPase subunit of ABC transporter with duplicated ATPase domains
VHGLGGGAVIVSHDREFLDRTVTRVFELDPNTLTASEYAGGWTAYAAARERARAEHERAFAEWEGERERFSDLHSRRRTEARAGGAKADRRGTHALMSKVRAAERRLERLDRDKVDKPWQPWRLRLDLAPAARAGDDVAVLEGAVIDRGRFRLGPVDLHLRWGERVAVVGRNGSGKSTLLAALVGRQPLSAGTLRLGPGVVVGEIEQRRGVLDGDEALLDAFLRESGMRSDEARTLLAKFDLYADHVLRSARTLSPGERTRAVLALQSARGANLLVLDEPTNHLDLPAIEELERALAEYTGTLVLVSHDRRFLEAVGVTRTLQL